MFGSPSRGGKCKADYRLEGDCARMSVGEKSGDKRLSHCVLLVHVGVVMWGPSV